MQAGRLFFLFFLFVFTVSAADVRIYKNEGCGHCVGYLEDLMEMLGKNGYTGIEIKDFMKSDEARREVAEIQRRFNVPIAMQGHLIVLIEDQYLFEGHVPVESMEDYLKKPRGPIVVTQDNMDNPRTYQMLVNNRIQTYELTTSFRDAMQMTQPIGQDELVQYAPYGLLILAGIGIVYSWRGAK